MVRTAVTTILVVLSVVGFFALPIEVEDQITVPGRMMPIREWTLVRSQNEAVESMVRDHLLGTVEQYALNRFERGDAIRITLNPSALSRGVAAGDTVASIYSSETERKLAALSGALDVSMASLDFYTAGEKSAVIEEEKMRMARAEERARQQAVTLERLRQLHARQLISDQELEIAESERLVLDVDIAVAQARLEAAQTGAKSQQLDIMRAEIGALQQEIDALKLRQSLFTITAPLSGVAVRSLGSDTLLTVRDTSAFLVSMPVRLTNHRRLTTEQAVSIAVMGWAEPLEGTVRRLGDTVHLVEGEQVLLAAAVVEDTPPDLLPGTLVRCTLSFGNVPLRTYALTVLRSMFS